MTQKQIIPLHDTKPGDRVTISFIVTAHELDDPHYVEYTSADGLTRYVALQDFIEMPDATVEISRELSLPNDPGVVFTAYMPGLLRDAIVETVGRDQYYVTGSTGVYYGADFDASTVKILFDPRVDIADCA
jgi:hypothetical protein